MAKERISGISIQPAHNVRFAISHAERTQLSAPSYLLPVQHRLPNRIIYAAGTEAELVTLHQERMAMRSRQAKRANAEAFLEGVLVLPPCKRSKATEYLDEMGSRLATWKQAFEAATGCTVVHISVHLDEGHMDQGVPRYNPHAHALIDRTQQSGHLWKPKRADLAAVQTLTAEALGMQRGSTAAERKGKPARPHIPHKQFRAMQEALKLEKEKTERLEIEHKATLATLAIQQAQSQAKEIYAALRGFLKGTGMATQTDYQTLKILHESKCETIHTLFEQTEEENHQEFFRTLRHQKNGLKFKNE